jgi:hypothetical protein
MPTHSAEWRRPGLPVVLHRQASREAIALLCTPRLRTVPTPLEGDLRQVFLHEDPSFHGVQRDQQVQRVVGSTKVEHGQVDNGQVDKVDNARGKAHQCSASVHGGEPSLT